MTARTNSPIPPDRRMTIVQFETHVVTAFHCFTINVYHCQSISNYSLV